MKRSSLFIRLGIALIGILVGPPAVLAEDAASPFPEVTVDLEGELVRQTLPFDVPFILTGEAPTGVDQITVRCWKLRTCREALKKSPTDTEKRFCDGKEKSATLPLDKTDHPDGDCPTWAGEPPTWTNRVDPGEETPTFNILVPRLEAESYYFLGFGWDRTTTDEEEQLFAQRVQKVADPVLWEDGGAADTLPAEGPLTTQGLADLRNDLVQALLTVTAADEIQDCSREKILCPQAVLDALPPAERAEVMQEFNLSLLPVRNAQSQIATRIRGYKREVDVFNRLLRAVQGDDALRRLHAALEQAVAETPSLADEAAAVAAVLALDTLPDLRREDRASADEVASFVMRVGATISTAASQIEIVRSALVQVEQGVACSGTEPEPLLEQLATDGALWAAAPADLAALAGPDGDLGKACVSLEVLRSVVGQIAGSLDQRAAARADLGRSFSIRAERIVLLAATTQGDFVTAQKNYLSGDGGVAFAPGLDEATSYVGTNIYSRPVNKAAPLSQFGNFWQTLDRRLALTIGLTVDGVGDGKTREDLFNNQSLVIGLGARFQGSLRLTAGAIVFKKNDPNPLVDDDDLGRAFFFSLSFDVDVVPALTGLGNVFKASG